MHRMFSTRVTESTRFIKMPASSQNLYFHLGMRADDDGIVEAYPVMCMIGATEDDLRVLVGKQFVTILNEDLVTFINDWTENNTIRADRKIDSIYQGLLLEIVPDAKIKESTKRVKQSDGSQTSDKCQPTDSVSKDKLSKDKLSKDNNIGYQQIADMYNATCVSFPQLKVLSDKRKKAIKARLNTYTVEDFKRLFEMAESSSFLKGANNRNWSATFDWLIADGNMAKVLDGNYKNRADSKPREETREERQARLMREWEEEQKNSPYHTDEPFIPDPSLDWGANVRD